MYQIHFKYTTGNTFGSDHGESGKFDYVFKDLDKAKAALQRMKEHYNWESDRHSAYCRDGKFDPPKWWKKCPKETEYGVLSNYAFNVEGNDGKEVWLNGITYLGYFEYLEEAEVLPVVFGKDGTRFVI